MDELSVGTSPCLCSAIQSTSTDTTEIRREGRRTLSDGEMTNAEAKRGRRLPDERHRTPIRGESAKGSPSDNPNPRCKGCPDPKTIRDLAFHRRIGTPEVLKLATAPMAGCSACVRDALGYAEE